MGNYGRILMINLSERGYSSIEIEAEILKKFIGGPGLAAHLYHRFVDGDIPPLDPRSPFITMTGPLTATPAMLSARHAFAGRSPLTGFWGNASVGGSWGNELRRTGFDGLIILGKVEKPTYLWLKEEELEFRDASHIWGLDTFETDSAIKKELGEKVQVCTIGPAGENLVKFAGIFTDGAHARTAARCGLGALMGSKNLKAIAVQGTSKIPIQDIDALRKSNNALLPGLRDKLKEFTELGTPKLVVRCEAMGNLPIKNWTRGKWTEGARKIGAQEYKEKYFKKRFHCAGCVVGCGRTVRGTIDLSLMETAGPEYETLAMMGSNCLIDDLHVLLRLNELVNRLGLDSIETGAVIAFCMELREKGLISSKDLGDIDLEWGNAKAAEELIRMMAYRKGFGDLLAEGLQTAANRIGGMAPEYAIQVKNMAVPAHDPRAYASVGLAYATSSRGPCHLNAFSQIFELATTFPEIGINSVMDRFQSEGKAEMVIKAQNLMHLWDNLALCKFAIVGGIQLHHVSAWLKLINGWDMDPKYLLEVGERSLNLIRKLNVRWGISRKNDTLPLRLITHRLADRSAGDYLPPFNILLADYYERRGWSKEGIPTEETLKKLGL